MTFLSRTFANRPAFLAVLIAFPLAFVGGSLMTSLITAAARLAA